MSFKFIAVLLLIPFTSFGLLDGLITIKDHTRISYDDNPFSRTAGNETNTVYVTKLINLQAILLQNGRTDIAFIYSPKIDYRELDDQTLFYQKATGKFLHSFTPRTKIDSSFKWSISEREPTDLDVNSDITWEQLAAQAKLSHTFTRKDSLSIEYSHKSKKWSENLNNADGDFEMHNVEALHIHEVLKGRLFHSIGSAASTLRYQNNRGGFDAIDIVNKYIYVVNKTTLLKLDGFFGHLTTIDKNGVKTGGYGPGWSVSLDSQVTRNLTLGIGGSYETTESAISLWNAKDIYKGTAKIRYRLSPKINVTLNGVFTDSKYLTEYDRYGANQSREDVMIVGIGSITYDITRNHALEAGGQSVILEPEGSANIVRNKFYVGYRLTL